MKFTYAAVAIAALALSACQEPKPAKQEPAAVQSQAGPEARPGITVAGGRLVLPVIAGNPGAAYFQIDNSAGANVAIAAIAINGAEKAEIHQTTADKMIDVDSVDIAPSTSIKFEPGQLHVMAFNLAPRLKAGGIHGNDRDFCRRRQGLRAAEDRSCGRRHGGMDHAGDSH